MRIVISADIEGASGVASYKEIGFGGGDPERATDYQAARHWLTGDINAAVEGAMEAGATAFVVHDSHGLDQRSVVLDELHPNVEVVRGRPVIFYQEEDLARGYDGAFMIAMHARAGQAGILSHVLNAPLISEVRLNGQPVGEAELTAALAGAYGIPTVLITGDDRVCLDVQRWSGGQIEAAVVKYSLTRYAVRALSLIEARERIRTAARQAVGRLGRAQPTLLGAPIELEVEWGEREVARYVGWLPQVSYDGERTVRYSDSDYRRVYRALLAMFWVATSRLTPGASG